MPSFVHVKIAIYESNLSKSASQYFNINVYPLISD